MTAVLEVVSPGAMSSLQDLGRAGWRRLGVPRSGALEPDWLRIANVLVGNPQETPAIEFFTGGLVVRAAGCPVRLALAGSVEGQVVADNGRRSVCAWQSLTLAPGEMLRCGQLAAERAAYLALGGISLRPQLGSAATYVPARLGGLDGQALAPGSRLLLQPDRSGGQRRLSRLPAMACDSIRVVVGPQDDHFTSAALACLLNETFHVSLAADRMGMRLVGPPLKHRSTGDVEIASDATLPGSIQVPANGQPIVLLADGQTVGGYPKIATVISADLPRLALRAPGAPVRFSAVSVATAEQAARVREERLQSLLASIEVLPERGTVDLTAIWSANLISGVVAAGEAGDALAVDGEDS